MQYNPEMFLKASAILNVVIAYLLFVAFSFRSAVAVGNPFFGTAHAASVHVPILIYNLHTEHKLEGKFFVWKEC
jgi:hypothetical protein